MCSRSIVAGEEAVKSIKDASDIGNIEVVELNLESLQSIRKCADAILGKYDCIDILVNNAGIMALPKLEYTENNFEKQIGVNHFGHFYFTSLLIPSMIAHGNPSRVVNIASTAHNFGSVDTNDLHYKKGRQYKPWEAYGTNK